MELVGTWLLLMSSWQLALAPDGTATLSRCEPTCTVYLSGHWAEPEAWANGMGGVITLTEPAADGLRLWLWEWRPEKICIWLSGPRLLAGRMQLIPAMWCRR